MRARMVRVGETGRARVPFRLDGAPVEGLEGDTVLSAVLTLSGRLRVSEFGDGPRAGFCYMGACQDCVMWTASGARLLACGTALEAGMDLVSTPPNAWAEPVGR